MIKKYKCRQCQDKKTITSCYLENSSIKKKVIPCPVCGGEKSK